MKCISGHKSLVLITLALVLCSYICMPPYAYAAESVASEKDETVYVFTSPDGSIKSTEVEVQLKNSLGAAKISDVSNLSGIESTNDKAHAGSGDSLLWEAGGDNVSYKGVLVSAPPVSLQVLYVLDGQPIAAEELAGKSGHVVIRYDFQNSSAVSAAVQGVNQTIYTPFTCVTAIMFDGKRFTNVSVENGKIINEGDDVIVAGYAMPGLKESLGIMAEGADIPDHFIVEADVTNFELKSTMTIATAGLLSDVSLDSLSLGNVDDAGALADAMNQLIGGSSSLTSGLEALASNVSQLEASAVSMNEGASALNAGLSLLASDSALGKLSSGVTEISGGIGLVKDIVSQTTSDVQDAINDLSGLSDETAGYTAALAVLENDKSLIPADDYNSIKQALETGQKTATTIASIQGKLSKTKAILDYLSQALEESKVKAAELASGANSAYDSAKQLSALANKLNEGTALINESVPQLVAAIQSAANGSKTLTQGMQTFNDQGVSQLVNTLKNDYGGMLDRMNALSDAAKSYSNIDGITEGTTGSVKFVFETDGIQKS